MTDAELLTWVRAVLTTTPERWLNLTAALPAELLERPPSAGEWSAGGCLQHLVETERLVFPVRVQCLLAGRDFPPFSPHRAEKQVEPSPQALAQSFAALRREGLTTLAQVTSADLEREGHHPDFGRVTLRQLLSTWAGHDLMHIVQAERALLQPFIAGVGPWQPYFADHQAGSKEG